MIYLKIIAKENYLYDFRKNFLFLVIGKNSEGSTVAQNFRMLKRKTSKKLKKDLSEITGLKMGQVKIVGK